MTRHANLSHSRDIITTARVSALRVLVILALLLGGATSASASGPRWVSGPPYFTTGWTMISWYTNQPAYFTDPGDLSPSVNHAAADAMVAQAATVWNIPTASLVLSQGGSLAEHISGANVFAGPNGPIFPADVQASNYAAKQIAVIYDTDGSVTDLLLGDGASDPAGCLQSGVTESVDSITPGAKIQHALLILNGRCTGPAPEKQLQMQYQLMRAFGRILGLGWSQTNDNVFTGSPTPTHNQAMNWPIMHPIDIVCGPYTYQCLPEPFTLRPDDISSLEELYFIYQGQAGPGKQASWSNAGGSYGYVSFPNGQGMEGVNVVVQRRTAYLDTPDDWQTASSTTGYQFRGQSPTSMTTQGTSPAASMGVASGDREGYWRIQSIPIPPSADFIHLVISTEPINPLYTGPYAIGAQAGNTMSPSGASQSQLSYYLANGRDNLASFTPSDAASTCSTQMDGSEGSPAPLAQGGWWTGTLCGYQHQAWSVLPVKADRTFTLEVTALDEQGHISLTKAMPIVGVWNSADPTGTLPTVASATTAFNSISLGLTTLAVQSSKATSFRIAIADQRGAGRPDFLYQARALYADTVVPANVGSSGGVITISGLGFRQGNAVLVNGVAAEVTSWSPTSITATAPSLHDLGLSRPIIATLTVQDLSTGGSSTMTGALTYAAPVEALQLVTAPSGSVPAGTVAPTTFSVRAIAPDGFTAIVGEPVSFVTTGARAVLSQCLTSPCTVLTDASGIATTSVTPLAQGSVTVTATGRSGSATASFTATANSDVLHLLSAPTAIATVGTAAATPIRVQLLAADGITPRAASAITLTIISGTARLGACSTLPCTLTTDATGTVITTIAPTSSGTTSVQLASLTSSVTASFSSAAESIQLKSAPAASQITGTPSVTPFVVKVLGGDGVTPVTGESVIFTATGASVTFSACGGAVCTLTTDAQGMVQSSVTASTAGAVTLTAVANAGAVTANFASATPPDVLHPVTVPAGIVYLGENAPLAFAVRITAADGVTPSRGKPVTFTASSGSAIFAACGTATCVVLTDATGLASTLVSSTAAGQLTLLAAAQAGSATSTVTVAARGRSVTPARPVQFVAENVSLNWAPQVTLTDDSASTSNVPVSWVGSPGLSFSNPSTLSNASGVALGSASAGVLAAGASSQGMACAWSTVCSPITVRAVGSKDWRITVVSGSEQSIAGIDTLAAVVLRVVNAQGNPIAGVPVQVEQTVSIWEAACPAIGRCPSAAVVSSSQVSAVSNIDGLVTISPAQLSGVASITQIAAIAGSQGFAALSLEKHP